MPGRNHRLTPLELRKQMLIVESELNRTQFKHEWGGVADGVRAVAHRAKSIGTFATSTAVLVSALAAFKGGGTAAPGAKPSRWRRALKGAGLISNFWLAFRARRRGPGDP